MLAVIEGHGPGVTKQEIADALRLEETNRVLVFEYCLITAGQSLNRAPSPQKWQAGKSCRSTQAGIITATSAISVVWQSRANRMPNSKICWRRSRRRSAPPWRRSNLVLW